MVWIAGYESLSIVVVYSYENPSPPPLTSLLSPLCVRSSITLCSFLTCSVLFSSLFSVSVLFCSALLSTLSFLLIFHVPSHFLFYAVFSFLPICSVLLYLFFLPFPSLPFPSLPILFLSFPSVLFRIPFCPVLSGFPFPAVPRSLLRSPLYFVLLSPFFYSVLPLICSAPVCFTFSSLFCSSKLYFAQLHSMLLRSTLLWFSLLSYVLLFSAKFGLVLLSEP